jgi:hypothetical protein
VEEEMPLHKDPLLLEGLKVKWLSRCGACQ